MPGNQNSVAAPAAVEPPTTQRAYTLRLRAVVEANDDDATVSQKRKELSDALWATHEAINNGAKAFGDWLLTLRGSLEHTLADAPAKGGTGKPDRAPTDDERRDRRVLLALSWLSVEDERGAPKDAGLIIAYGDDCVTKQDSQDGRDRRVIDALRGILAKRGLTPATIEEWMTDCQGSLKARIRDDAVWVNRSERFDALCAVWTGLTRQNSRQVLDEFFGSVTDWVTLPAPASEGDGDDGGEEKTAGSGGAGDGEEFRTIARSFLSTNFGTGTKSDKGGISDALSQAAKSLPTLPVGFGGSGVLKHLCVEFGLSGTNEEELVGALRERIGWKSGRRSKGRLALDAAMGKASLGREDIDLLMRKFTEEAAEKGAKSKLSVPPWIGNLNNLLAESIGFGFVAGKDQTGPYGVMLDHAARRVSIACSWIKLAELERRKFESDAKKLDEVRSEHPAAAAFLDSLGRRRAEVSGSANGTTVLIRKRAIMGWKEVVASWSGQACTSSQDRIDAVRGVQDEVEKFGDGRLFEELAADDAGVVWQRGDGAADPTILERYSAGCVAEVNQQRFKVPAYRHPDPLRHPVFGDFGVSRMNIEFAVHERVRAIAAARRVRAADAQWHEDSRNMRMEVWNGVQVTKLDLRWSSKRLSADLALDDPAALGALVVVRADRLGRSTAGRSPVHVQSVFAEDNWNGRLQAPRVELDRIASLVDCGKTIQANKRRDRISWLVSFSPKLAPCGPFIEYAAANGIEPNKKSGEYWPNSATNKDRKGQNAKLIYSRLPGLRILAVDLGHRYAAGCAVWESLSSDGVSKAVSKGMVVRGGTGSGDLFVHIETVSADGKRRTTVYRRIGAEKLPDGSVHPAPWARLERQFLIKLQGEEQSTRMAAPDEFSMVVGWEKAIGYQALPDSNAKREKNVGDLMASAVRLFTLGGRRHFDRARIAHNLVATKRTKPGGVLEPLTRDGRIDLLTETLALWHGLFAGDRWTDEMANAMWSDSGLPDLATPTRGDDDGRSFGGRGRKAAVAEYHAKLRPHAERLAETDLSKLAKRWSDRWLQDDRRWTEKGGRLQSLRKWTAPRGLRPTATDSVDVKNRKAAAALRARHVGGLSMQRINTLGGLYRLLKAFKNRPEPSDLRKNIPAKGDDRLIGFNQRLLDVRDRLREQRVKQLASRITEATLGLGRVHSRDVLAGAARPTSRVDEPCHAVVIESLTNYRPDELQTRRENRQLMVWSSAKVQKYLAESCQLHGIHLRQLQPSYTSRQCSRTGAAGIRAVEISARDLLARPWCKKAVAKAKANLERAKRENRAGSAMDRLMVSAEEWAMRMSSSEGGTRELGAKRTTSQIDRIVLPRRGGDLFVSVSCHKNKNGKIPTVQADVNAAANIGIRALLDSDWEGRWWWVPCDGGTYTPAAKKTAGAMPLNGIAQLPQSRDHSAAASPPASRARDKKSPTTSDKSKPKREFENRWRHCASDPLQDSEWVSTGEYWSKVDSAVCEVLSSQTR